MVADIAAEDLPKVRRLRRSVHARLGQRRGLGGLFNVRVLWLY